MLIIRMFFSYIVMYQISLLFDCKEFYVNFFNVDIIFIEWWFLYVEDCFIDLYVLDYRFEWVIFKYMGGFNFYDIKFCICFSIDFLNFGCYM